eukprot:CAMPEP_0197046788 /NCGR_PEP_ID=MMETSP1384-20130603/22423_1 /TAXON_ID=29189 /ORGANISM="Ammonia sp." /LENGTH=265 /DNA_ID=CAMNT_0042478627 /DNA_START=27 /DNA_END=821 /DNA_ORIENTATION=+
MERPPVIKLLTLGDSGSGKSSLLLRYTDDEYNDEFVTTIGMDFKFKRVLLNDSMPVKVQIWDTAGQERFRTITQNYYRGAHGIVLVCSVDDDESKTNVKRWMQDLRESIRGENFNAILVMNKIDLATDEDEVERETQELADEMGVDYVLTSAKENIGVTEAFTMLVEQVHTRLYGNASRHAMHAHESPVANRNGGWFQNFFGQKTPTQDANNFGATDLYNNNDGNADYGVNDNNMQYSQQNERVNLNAAAANSNNGQHGKSKKSW